MTASLPLPVADDFDRAMSLLATFQELAHIWATDHSLLLDRVSVHFRTCGF